MYLTTTLTRSAVLDIVERVADGAYDGNILADVEHVGRRVKGARAGQDVYRVKLNARDSRGEGARRSWSGRRGPWTCWHAFRDVFAAWLIADPRAHIRTGVETYDGAAAFLDRFPATGHRNIGSMVQPLAMADACDCELDNDGRDVRGDMPDWVADLEDLTNLRGHANYAAAYGPTGTYGQ